jgi:hypothetical protein
MSTFNYDAAVRLASAKIEQLALDAGDVFEIVPGESIEIDDGWLFFFNTADYIRTREPTTALAGNAPVLVLRTGEVVELSSAMPWQDAVLEARSASGAKD